MSTNLADKSGVKIKSVFAFMGAVFFVFALTEIFSYTFIRLHYHIDPMATGQEVYSRTVSGYYVVRNSPNFSLSTLDGLNHFKPNTTIIDSNGFIADRQVRKTKDANTIRIFLIGGSTAFGYIQSQNIVRDRTYPSGTYDYPSSISGLLKEKLQKSCPGKKIEVINAAVPLHFFHQGYLEYLSLLHDFSPDIIINMDGNNDDGSINTGMPFACAEHPELENLVALKNGSQRRWPFTLFLWKYYRERNFSKQAAKTTPANINFTESDYKAVEPVLISKSQALIWLVASYENQLSRDNVHSIFVLQPLLRRTSTQKKLTPLEKNLLEDSQREVQLDLGDPAVLRGIKDMGCEDYLKILGSKTAALPNIMCAYYFDRYFSSQLDSIVSSYGGDYMDMNKEISGLSDSTDFFVDYCHLTPYGNDFVAQKLAGHVAGYIKREN